jgi:hypothetical protein
MTTTKNFTFSTFKHCKDNKAKNHTVDLVTLAKGLLMPMGNKKWESKQELPAWSPTIFQNGQRMGQYANIISMVVFDMDDGLAPFDSWRLFHEWTVLAHTSFSHKPQHHKYRIILPLETPLPAEDWDRISVAMLELWSAVVGRGIPDEKARKDKARIYYRFAIPNATGTGPMNVEEYHQTAFHSSGRFLNLDYSHVKIENPKPKPIQAQVYQNGKAAMSEMMMDPRFRLGMANQLGAKIQGNEARYMLCPGCGRNSMHFSIDPNISNSYKWPHCNHENSCGWYGNFTKCL